MPVYTRQQLSGSTNGLPIEITSTDASAPQVLHVVQATSTSALESVYLNFRNLRTVDHVVFIDIETATATASTHPVYLESQNTIGDSLKLFEGLPLTATGTRILAYSAVAGTTWSVDGYVNRIATG